MKIAVGGAYQGKCSVMAPLFGLKQDAFLDGASCSFGEIFHARGVDHFHAYIGRALQEGKSLAGFAGRLFLENPHIVVIADEVGSGVVPVEADARRYRECVGRICGELASFSEEVWRVICGIPVCLKETGAPNGNSRQTGVEPGIVSSHADTDPGGAAIHGAADSDREIVIHLVRHGQTPGNEKHQYIGRTDEELSAAGADELRKRIYPLDEFLAVSPMLRCRQSAEIICPELVPAEDIVPGLRECDFGAFEGKTWEELKEEPAYQAYIDSGGETAFPGGESAGAFRTRVREAFFSEMEKIVGGGWESATFTVHGGTLMAVLYHCAPAGQGKKYWDWHVPCGGGFRCVTSASLWKSEKRFSRVDAMFPAESNDF